MRRLWVALLALLLDSATCQLPWDIADGPIVMYRYQDPNCTQRVTTGEWMQQSWKKIEGADYCYDVTQGMHCTVGPCVIKLSCAFESGSGIVYRTMGRRDCSGAPTSQPVPLLPSLTWLGGIDFLTKAVNATDACLQQGSDANPYYLAFEKPLREAGIGFPDCSVQGDVATVGKNGEAVSNFVEEYDFQFYSDDNCMEPYNVTASSTKMTSSFTWKVHRGAEHCYDMVDTTPRSNETSRVADYNKLGMRLVCGNPDGVGNGYLIQSDYSDVKCRGTFSLTETWRSVYHPMNYPVLKDLFDGNCIRWGQRTAKFAKPWNQTHYPQCAERACSKGLCAGGRMMGPGAVTGVYGGEIAQAPSNQAQAPTSTLPLAVALLASLLAVDMAHGATRRS